MCIPGKHALLPFLLLFLVVSPAIANATTTWNDSTRDLYIDGRLDREAQLLLAEDSGQAAVVSEALPEAVVFDLESLAIGTLEKESFAFSPDRTSASSAGPAALDKEGDVLKVDDRSFMLRIGQHTILVAPHMGNAGDMTLDDLWRTVPVWQARSAMYEPAPELVSALRDIDRDVDLTLVFGTWCGDSKHYVPEILKTIDLAANDHIRVRLVSIQRGFEHPLDFVRDRKVTNVPTMIVSENGEERGRMVETPALDSAEADLVAILAGRTPPHQGRWTRERRIARGTYHYLGDDGLRGTEEWEIFSAPDDKTLVHSRLQLGDSTTETWQRSDADGVTNFVEITRQTGPDLSRSRFWIEDGHVQSVTRGNATGIVEQTLELPDGWTVLLPVAVSAISSANGGRTRALRLEAAGAPTSGRLYLQELQINGREEITTPAGRFEADRIVRRVGGTESVWWLHPDLEVPVQGQREDGARVVLVEVEQFGDSD